jgi:hypothetical protein
MFYAEAQQIAYMLPELRKSSAFPQPPEKERDGRQALISLYIAFLSEFGLILFQV